LPQSPRRGDSAMKHSGDSGSSSAVSPSHHIYHQQTQREHLPLCKHKSTNEKAKERPTNING
jgi:hypothetical protein